VLGLAAALGGLFPVPHGAACGTLVAEVTLTSRDALRQRSPSSPALEKYARVGRLVSGGPDDDAGALTATLAAWVDRLQLPGLAMATVADLPRLVADSRGSSMRTNPSSSRTKSSRRATGEM
jgi:alcohol dehydrogenase